MSPVKHKITTVQGIMARLTSSWNFIQVYSSRNSRVLVELVCRETPNKDEEQINAEKMDGECLGFSDPHHNRDIYGSLGKQIEAQLCILAGNGSGTASCWS